MSTLVEGLPDEVQEFMTKCRERSYDLKAKPNYLTHIPGSSSFRYKSDGLVYTDVSLSQWSDKKGRYVFMGTESVSVTSRNPALMGKRWYICNYRGGEESQAELLNDLAGKVQHGIVITCPTLARAGASSLFIAIEEDGKHFNYSEVSTGNDDVRHGRETLTYLPEDAKKSIVVFQAETEFITFKIR